MQAGWWGADKRSSSCRSWPQWLHRQAWRRRISSRGSWISVKTNRESDGCTELGVALQTKAYRLRAHLHCSHQLGAFTDALLDVAALLVSDGRMLRRALVGHQDPEHVPKYPKASWTDHESEDTKKQTFWSLQSHAAQPNIAHTHRSLV